TAMIWDAETGVELTALLGHGGPVYSVAFSPDGSRLATASGDATAKIWNAASPKELITFREDGWVTSVAYSPDGRRLAIGSDDKTAQIWDALTGREQRTLSGHRDWVNSIAFSPDGKRLATASGESPPLISA